MYLQQSSVPGQQHRHEAFLAFGSNLGDRYANIHRALQELGAASNVWVTDSSHLYESLPMYYSEQGRFLNGVVKVDTTLSPVELLRHVKHVEHNLGRRKTINNGPREVDLDILLYGQQILHDKVNDLIVPHQRIAEREFVLRPLADLIPEQTLPRFNDTPRRMLRALTGPSELTTVTPLSRAGMHHPEVIVLGRRSSRDVPAHPSEDTIVISLTKQKLDTWREAAKQGKSCRVATTSASHIPSTESSRDWLYVDTKEQGSASSALTMASSIGAPVLLDTQSVDSAAKIGGFLELARRYGVKRWQVVFLGNSSSRDRQSWASSYREWPWVFYEQ